MHVYIASVRWFRYVSPETVSAICFLNKSLPSFHVIARLSVLTIQYMIGYETAALYDINQVLLAPTRRATRRILWNYKLVSTRGDTLNTHNFAYWGYWQRKTGIVTEIWFIECLLLMLGLSIINYGSVRPIRPSPCRYVLEEQGFVNLANDVQQQHRTVTTNSVMVLSWFRNRDYPHSMPALKIVIRLTNNLSRRFFSALFGVPSSPGVFRWRLLLISLKTSLGDRRTGVHLVNLPQSVLRSAFMQFGSSHRIP
ncbi:hypothetical protein Trydic_g7470 [Trypoxylus dichotomus]